MPLLLGVDTGGTYTDAVLICDEETVIASAKSLTTRHDLAIGIGGAIQAVLAESAANPSDITLASLSTTLATNALVEGQGERIGLVYIGFRALDIDAHGLADVLKGDPSIVLSGGHNHAGGVKDPFDEEGLRTWLAGEGGTVSAYAVASQFATRNPEHELAAARIIAEVTGRSVSQSHQLSAKLNGPKRALTAVLNARLIGMIDRLIAQAGDELVRLGISAPLMVVRGDGALIGSNMARERPIETILSGPAASIVGARWLTGADHALVSDIGGTTTDVAVLRNGQPTIDPAGARVGPHRTMVEAVAMHTTGLGGDSQVHFVSEGLSGGVTLGPRRRIPISLIATQAPVVVLAALDRQLASAIPGEHDGVFARLVPNVACDGVSDRELSLLDRLDDAVKPLGALIQSRLEMPALRKLVDRGILQLASLTPSDAAHALGLADAWDADAARMALMLFGRRRTGAGEMLAKDPAVLAQIIIDQLTHQTGIALLECAFAEEAIPFGPAPSDLARHTLMQRGLSNNQGLIQLKTGLAVDVVGLGASAKTYYPAVGELLNTGMILPEHAGVANAIGAVVGRVTIRKRGTITSPSEGKFRVHLDDGPVDFAAPDPAFACLQDALTAVAKAEAIASGVTDIDITATRDIQSATAEASDVFLEATIVVEASGRPRITAD
ncbi:hydantoinase/oxoprolinase N-terminal domain-containing protein [Thalassobium sp. R2A62]|jgi:N-methylhydantoinase A/oxoprolinase/acetone carboxylase beta subunit|uniref:hydantoinase/oxoprolinase N-terminal domain-containing protein n=1 Tax=Thalassobium sp. R2A62 TaxID=633131 RepID=UPI0001B1CF40|nr:hydantoinase/oxoprolinase family protein [Thalassobium sp. R2A62]EET47016.1 hydantoinase/oxoprolinase [Thalassobium sp. R2A62]MDG1341022.1 hydantoinase/oxoprolinase family protein [Paracoccaceae bacterium]